MSALAASCGMSMRVTFGSRATAGGWSHSWVTPTSADSRPSAQTISVALGSSDTIRIAGPLLQLLVELADELRQRGDLGRRQLFLPRDHRGAGHAVGDRGLHLLEGRAVHPDTVGEAHVWSDLRVPVRHVAGLALRLVQLEGVDLA